MVLAVSHDVLAEGFGVLAGMTVVSHHLDVRFSIAVQNVADHQILE
ncbi:MAG: hypothetical protein GKS07_07250 [Nitrosopumilus sp.]|nr:MAG: hypothetical protein GKS07_07250 [Nitrosopumilus sp.]